MASFPTAHPKRISTRKLGRGQFPTATGVACAVTGAASTVTLTFARPVVVTGTIPITVAGLTITSQSVVSPTVVNIVMSGTVATHAWTLPAGVANVLTYQGGPVLGSTGTF